jgi:hypothetical protein
MFILVRSGLDNTQKATRAEFGTKRRESADDCLLFGYGSVGKLKYRRCGITCWSWLVASIAFPIG